MPDFYEQLKKLQINAVLTYLIIAAGFAGMVFFLKADPLQLATPDGLLPISKEVPRRSIWEVSSLIVMGASIVFGLAAWLNRRRNLSRLRDEPGVEQSITLLKRTTMHGYAVMLGFMICGGAASVNSRNLLLLVPYLIGLVVLGMAFFPRSLPWEEFITDNPEPPVYLGKSRSIESGLTF